MISALLDSGRPSTPKRRLSFPCRMSVQDEHNILVDQDQRFGEEI